MLALYLYLFSVISLITIGLMELSREIIFDIKYDDKKINFKNIMKWFLGQRWQEYGMVCIAIILAPLIWIAFMMADISNHMDRRQRRNMNRIMLGWEQRTIAANNLNLVKWHNLDADTRYTMLRETIKTITTKDLKLILGLNEQLLKDDMDVAVVQSLASELADRQLLS